MPMTVVKPIAVTPAMLVATDVLEADYPAWAAGTTYALNDRVILASTHKVYQCVQAPNTGKDPATNPLWWSEVSPTNRWKAFDLSNSTQTAQATSLYYEVKPGSAVNAVAALNLTGPTSIRIRVTDPSFGLVYDKTTQLNTIPPDPTWYSWFFGERTYLTQHIALDLPTYPNATIRVDLAGNSALAMGVLLLGDQKSFGVGVQYGARLGIRDYSRKKTNEWGDTVLEQRAFSKMRGFTVAIKNKELDRVEALLTSLRATPALWVGLKDYAALTAFGFYSDFQVLVAYPTESDCDITIEGLT